MWLKIFSIIPIVGEIAALLMVQPRSIRLLASAALRLINIAAPKAGINEGKIMAGAAWIERAKADGVISADEILELGMLLDIKVDIPVK
jgi:hypothetical protein